MENLVERLNKLKIYGAKIKKVLDTEERVYLLYSASTEHGAKSWFSDKEIDTNWNVRFYSKSVEYAERLGFNFSEEEKNTLVRESYNLLGFDK